jgi:hypothetical protein
VTYQRKCSSQAAPLLTPEQELLEDGPPDEGMEDDSDVPFAEVCAHHIETSSTFTIPLPVDPAHVYVPNETGGLSSTAGSENTLVEAVGDQVVNVTPDLDSTTQNGRGRRIRRQNVRYAGKWWHDHQNEAVDADFV